MKKRMIFALLAIVTLGLVFAFSSPTKVPAFILILPFVCIFVSLSCGLWYVAERKGLSRARGFRFAAIGAGVPVILLVLQSIGQLTIRDLLTLGAIFTILYFYLARLSFRK